MTLIKSLLGMLTVLGLTTGLLFGFRMRWPDTKQPGLPLPSAYTYAATALGSATNQFYCIRGHCEGYPQQNPNGQWVFLFCTTNGQYKTVYVRFDKTIHIADGREEER
jgi:hypothetical protein